MWLKQDQKGEDGPYPALSPARHQGSHGMGAASQQD